jgi:hypothetical protein
MTSCIVDFPELAPIQETPIDNIEHTIVELYLNLCRKRDTKSINIVFDKMDSLLGCISSDCDPDSKELHIKMLYKMIAHTRDISYGKGEKDITYMLICVWYKHFPVSAIFALRSLVISENDEHHSPYGSWCDIKYFCRYVKYHSLLSKKQDKELIDSAIGIMNHQLNNDRIRWNKVLGQYFEEVINNPATLTERPIGRDYMSFAAKWSPRENSKFGWLYELIVIQWTQMFTPHLLNVSEDKREKSVKNFKKNYRKMISALNKELDTVQIKQCNNKWSDINPENVSIGTIIKQKNAFSKTLTDDRLECKTNFNDYYDEVKEFGDYEHQNKKSLLPISTIVSGVMALLLQQETNNANSTYIDKQISWYNHIWNKNLKSKKGLRSSIPIIDISWDMDIDSRNSAIGLGILIAQRSDLHRFIVYENTAHWVIINEDDTFCDILKKVYELSKHPTNSNIDTAFSMLLEAIVFTKYKSTCNDINKDTVYVFDTDDTIDARSDMIFFIFNGGKQVNQILKRFFSTSFFVYWNIQRDNYLQIKNVDLSPNNFYLCGNSISSIDDIDKFDVSYLRKTTMYKFISNVLSNTRYDYIGKHLNTN